MRVPSDSRRGDVFIPLQRTDVSTRNAVLYEVERTPGGQWPGFYPRHGKRALDIVVAGAMLLCLWPLMLILAGLVALDGGPPIFGHERVGRGGRRFSCLKLRSMVPDAPERLKAILAADPAAAAEWKRGRKLTWDPRVTRLGRFLRTTSLDELPQLLNVLRGDMSLVGPRPITDGELDRYEEHVATYLSLRPGLTGPWQVMGRNGVAYADRVQLDAEYGTSLSLAGDLRILVLTAVAVLQATGR